MYVQFSKLVEREATRNNPSLIAGFEKLGWTMIRAGTNQFQFACGQSLLESLADDLGYEIIGTWSVALERGPSGCWDALYFFERSEDALWASLALA